MKQENEITFKKVSKEEFETFVSTYPNELEKSVHPIFEPPVVAYNDFSTGKNWPDSVVARTDIEHTGYYIKE